MSHSNIQGQRGGTLLGFILGLVIGLTVALGVAMYVTKVPMPFSNKNLSRSADQDAVEAQKNKDWNPNGALQSKPVTPEAPAEANANNSGASNANVNVPAPAVTADPLTDLIKKQNPNTTPTAPSSGSTSAAATSSAEASPAPPPAATPQPANKTAGSNDPFTYFVQAGAFKSAADADAQKAKLSMMGIEAKVSEREQAGRAIYRVRSGPFDDKDQAEKIKSRIDSSGIDAALVRVQR